MKPDIVVCWPRNCDYPLWRAFLDRERERFGEVIVVFTELGEADYRPFLRSVLPAECHDSPPVGRDWRDTAVNYALDRSRAERVWFTEQDFTITDPALFWPQTDGPVVGIDAGDGRPFHPACLFVDRAVIERTSRYFGTPPVDHFYTFGRELPEPHRYIEGGWTHRQGTSQNHTLIERGIDEGVYRRAEFRDYLRASLEADVPMEPRWIESARREIG